ncbi:hypothetical protein Lal_00014167 [Lupinus albus]|nr:hypothetical protein Lal_00014167 [Lupinus albus]
MLAYVRDADVSWLVEQGFQFPHELEVQGSNPFIELLGKLYPSLIREFYSNFIYKDGNYVTMIRGKMIVLDEDLFLAVGGLSSSGAPLGDCENEQEKFDAVNMYKSCLRDSISVIPGGLTKVGALTVESRLLHYVIAYILVQCNTNHAQPTTHDSKLMFAIREGNLVKWPAEILRVMSSIASSSSRLLAYGIFISRIINHMEIETSDVDVKLTNTHDHLLETPAEQPKQPAEQPEASQVSQAPPFVLAHSDAMEQRINQRLDVGFQMLSDNLDSSLMSLYDWFAADIQRGTDETKNEIDKIAFMVQTMSVCSHPPHSDKPS